MDHKLKFNHVLIFSLPKIHPDTLRTSIEDLIDALEKHSATVTLEESTAGELGIKKYPTLGINESWQSQDLIISVGGDGTFLQAGRKAALEGVPIIGINRGKLGFLTDILPNEISQKIPAILNGKYHDEERFLLNATLRSSGECIGIGLNDIVFFAGDHLHMFMLDIAVNDEPVFTLRGDGLIVSTPTGSTAYGLSAGGSILHPNLAAIQLIPMYPHTLNNRPIVIDSTAKLTVHISEENPKRPRLSADGQPHLRLNQGSSIDITAHPKKLKLLHPLDYNYFETLRSKLNWQSHPICSNN